MRSKLFFALIAVIAIVGCSKESTTGLDELNGPSAMLKVNIKAAGTITKAAPGAFEYGSATENIVNRVDFYFFKADGTPYSVVTSGNSIGWTPKNGTPAESVEAISNVVLVIKKSQKALPAKVVAVVNSVVDYEGMPLGTLATKIAEELSNNKYGFVMSNSVYADGNVVVNATDILPENIFSTDAELPEAGSVIDADVVAELEINPVDIYVERIAAKVRVSAAENVNLDKMPVMSEDGKTPMVDSAGNAVYAKVLGWDVTNIVRGANTLKSINASWTNLGFTPWNAADLSRSYWASTPESLNPEHPHAFAELTKSDAKYYFENTKPAAENNNVEPGVAGSNQTPQLLVAVQLVDANDKAVELAKWFNVLYTIEGLKTAMVNQIASKLYIKEETTVGDDDMATTVTTYRSVKVADVVFKQTDADAEDNRYEVVMTANDKVTYYSAAGAATGTALSAGEVKAIIDGVEPAQMWTAGSAYYYTNIMHYGTATGMVRNHVYDIKLSAVKGFGTPVYDPSHIITPERPDDQPAANLAAQINILSWHVVPQNVTLQ